MMARKQDPFHYLDCNELTDGQLAQLQMALDPALEFLNKLHSRCTKKLKPGDELARRTRDALDAVNSLWMCARHLRNQGPPQRRQTPK